MARVPFANVGMVKVPDSVTDEQALMMSDIFPTGYFGADLAHIHSGSTVSVFGCGPVGQFAIISALLMGAGRALAVDCIDSRLQKAREKRRDHQLRGGERGRYDPGADRRIGTDRAIDAVGTTPSTRTVRRRRPPPRRNSTRSCTRWPSRCSHQTRPLASGRCAVPGAPRVQSVAKGGTAITAPTRAGFFPSARQ
jgi:threonine dehydrogenase-like Zn-dependent dehydrogenase